MSDNQVTEPSETATPETDEQEFYESGNYEVNWPEHARKLERERDQLRAELAKAQEERDAKKSLAQRCFDNIFASDELFETAQVILGGGSCDKCLDPEFQWMLLGAWVDDYDSSVEVVLSDLSAPMTRDQAMKFIELGFSKVYESQGDRGVLWYHNGTCGPCLPKKCREEQPRETALRYQLATLTAALDKAREDSKRLDWLEANFEQVFQRISSDGFFYFDKVKERHERKPTLRAAIDAAKGAE